MTTRERNLKFSCAIFASGMLLAGCAGGTSMTTLPKGTLAIARTAADSGRALPGSTSTPTPNPCGTAGDSGRALPGDSGRALPGNPDCPSTNWQGSQVPGAAPTATPQTENLCGKPDGSHANCHSEERQDLGAQNTVAPPNVGYRPLDLDAAYGIPQGLGNGQTVALIEAGSSPTAESDLAVYRSAFGLPACSSHGHNACLSIVSTIKHPPQASPGWLAEIALDLDMVSAVCPGCNILLVEAASNALTDLASAVDLAASYDPAAISNSYYAQIDPVQDALLAPHYDQPGIAMTVASGDGGYGATFPASLDTVIAVGATTLWAGKNGWQETVWAGTGFGCSPLSPKPKWQRDHQCPMRTHNDVSIVGDPLTGVLIYDTSTPGYKGWSVIGGTSVGAPLIAALYAASGDAGNANGAQALYAKGNNAFYQVPFKCPSSMIICSIAGPYSAAAGLGAPKGLAPF